MIFLVEDFFVSHVLPTENKKEEKIKKVLKETKVNYTKHQRQRKAKKYNNNVVNLLLNGDTNEIKLNIGFNTGMEYDGWCATYAK